MPERWEMSDRPRREGEGGYDTLIINCPTTGGRQVWTGDDVGTGRERGLGEWRYRTSFDQLSIASAMLLYYYYFAECLSTFASLSFTSY